MTGQFHDVFRRNERDFDIVGVSGGELFAPAEHGLTPFPTCSACWRGYLAHYAIRDDRLVLERLDVSLGHRDATGFHSDAGPAIHGVRPTRPTETDALFNNRYSALDLPIAFSGRILIGTGFIQELYVHMGFQPAWRYRSVFELTFERGRLLEERDVSARMEELRREEKRIKHGDTEYTETEG